METWLKDSDEIWLAASDLNKKGHKISSINSENKHSGGILLLYNKTLRIDLMQQNNRPIGMSIHLHVI